ncbi:ImmA/IrrE family metallo-endopeptidase [Acidilutibacter cellobiosedens]|uniref:ImmA/IrrE family metallo-endopeptidase n=1 Tax=Acidilutibacter cellobiosedens TaxID=2507161 RepID=A0A410QDC8_9FIRM|nr:ImmA/IrrE family metallo-endopeptidase [Acidilutibacter cellobiosedens]QAT61996.1 ImmA/IrrE family metallo-endopeptidase [Acidilutibacter cellobiosedens]
MIKLNFKKRENGVPILSRMEIENIAERILKDYDNKILSKPNSLDIEDFVEIYLDLYMDYKDLSNNQSILGMTVFNDCYVTIYDPENNDVKDIPVREGTIFIDNSFLNSNQIGRKRFTLGHEASHWLLHKFKYGFDSNQMTFLDESPQKLVPVTKCRKDNIERSANIVRKLVSDDDWVEWQADYLASTLLMPKATFSRVVKKKFIEKGITKGYYEYNNDKNLDLWINTVVSELADIFNVSITAAKIRLKNLEFVKEKGIGKQSFID